MHCTNDDNAYGETYIEEIQCSGNENKYFGIIQQLRKMKERSMLGQWCIEDIERQ